MENSTNKPKILIINKNLIEPDSLDDQDYVIFDSVLNEDFGLISKLIF